MERAILFAVDYCLLSPTVQKANVMFNLAFEFMPPYRNVQVVNVLDHFINRYDVDHLTANLAHFIADMCLLSYDMVKYRSSLVCNIEPSWTVESMLCNLK